VGIDLQELWFALNQDLAAQGLGPAIAAVGAAAAQAAAPSRRLEVVKVASARVRPGLMASPLAGTFSNCFRCVTCSNVCPVVRYYGPDPRQHLDLLPHQIMHSLGLGLKEEALGARMTWSCLTCYQCQEACPQGVRVADVLMELRNQASGLASSLASGPASDGRI
jgi:heterodisulfide reductase subunit C